MEKRPSQAIAETVPDVEPFHVIRTDVLLDVPRDEAVFNLETSEVADLHTVDQAGRQSHSFQFFVDEPSLSSFYLRARGLDVVNPLLIVRGEEVHLSGELVVREVVPFYDCGTEDPECGGWGPSVASVPIQQDRERITFRLPLSVFNAPDGSRPGNPAFSVHYFLELYRFGASTGPMVQALAQIGLIDAPIDVKPGDPNNTINGKAARRLVVNVLTTEPSFPDQSHFDATLIDVSTLTLGPRHAHPLRTRLTDADGDGDADLQAVFATSNLGLSCIDVDVRLTGETLVPEQGFARVSFVGFDTVDIPDCKT